LREEHKLQDFGNMIRKISVPTRDEVTKKFRTLHDKEQDLYRSATTVGAGVAQSVE
jgi:hypothetical protein